MNRIYFIRNYQTVNNNLSPPLVGGDKGEGGVVNLKFRIKSLG
jgi:hypothetical protein